MAGFINRYFDPDAVAATIEAGNHRSFVGGMWDAIGRHQFEYLKAAGMRPEDRVLDVGCGCFRVGIHLVDFLAPGNYYGIDLSADLMKVGYEVELAERDMCGKLPRENLHATDRFDAAGFGQRFDVIFAQSVFTHLPLNHLKLALHNLAGVARAGCRFHATVFLVPEGADWSLPQPIKRIQAHSSPDRDPFHYTPADIRYAAGGLPWSCRIVGDWGHARGQAMVEFTRTGA